MVNSFKSSWAANLVASLTMSTALLLSTTPANASQPLRPTVASKTTSAVTVTSNYADGWVKTVSITKAGKAKIVLTFGGTKRVKKVTTPRTVRVSKRADAVKIVTTLPNGKKLKPWKRIHETGRGGSDAGQGTLTPGEQQLNPDAGSYWCKSSEWYINNAKPSTIVSDTTTMIWWRTMTLLFNDPRCILNYEGRLEEISDHVWVGNGLGFPYPNPNLTTLPVDNPLWKISPGNPYYKNVDGYKNAASSLWTDQMGQAFHDTVVNTINTRRATECGLPALTYNTTWVNTLLWTENLGDEGDIEDTYGQPEHLAQLLYGSNPFASQPSLGRWASMGSSYTLPLSTTTGLPITAKWQEVITVSLSGQVSNSATTSDFCAINSNTKSVAVKLNSPQDNGDIRATVWLLGF